MHPGHISRNASCAEASRKYSVFMTSIGARVSLYLGAVHAPTYRRDMYCTCLPCSGKALCSGLPCGLESLPQRGTILPTDWPSAPPRVSFQHHNCHRKPQPYKYIPYATTHRGIPTYGYGGACLGTHGIFWKPATILSFSTRLSYACPPKNVGNSKGKYWHCVLRTPCESWHCASNDAPHHLLCTPFVRIRHFLPLHNHLYNTK